MKKYILLFFIIVALPIVSLSQDTITVAEITLKSVDSETIFFGFAKGDKIVIDFTGYLSEIEVTFCPNSKVYRDRNISEISHKTIYVPKEGIYQFKLNAKSSYTKDGHSYRVDSHKLIIRRIPKDESTIDFNTSWEWATINDTTYTYYTEDSLIGYDTLRYKEKIKAIDNKSIDEVTIIDNVFSVDIEGVIFERTPFRKVLVSLPENEDTEYKTKEVVAWAYWIGVGENASSIFSDSEFKSSVNSIAGMIFSPLGALAVGAIMEIATPKTGESIVYAVLDQPNSELYMKGEKFEKIQGGNGPGGYGKFIDKSLCQGKWYICMYNEYMHKINVTVKVCAIVETTTYKDTMCDKEKITPKYQTVNKRTAKITPMRVRVNAK